MASILTSTGAETIAEVGVTITSASFTPNANRLLIACVGLRGNGVDSVSGITGHDDGDSWAFIDDDADTTQPTNFFNFEVWACITGPSPSADTVVVTKTSDTADLILLEAPADFSLATVALSVLQSAAMKEYSGAALDISPVLAAFGDAANGMGIFGFSLGSGTISTLTATGDLTQDFQYTNAAGPGIFVGSQDSNDTTPIVDDTDTFTCKGGIAFELAFAAGAPGTRRYRVSAY